MSAARAFVPLLVPLVVVARLGEAGDLEVAGLAAQEVGVPGEAAAQPPVERRGAGGCTPAGLTERPASVIFPSASMRATSSERVRSAISWSSWLMVSATLCPRRGASPGDGGLAVIGSQSRRLPNTAEDVLAGGGGASRVAHRRDVELATGDE